jgi:hypothetical protein
VIVVVVAAHTVLVVCIYILYICAILKRLATTSDFHTPLPSIVPFAHSETPFAHSETSFTHGLVDGLHTKISTACEICGKTLNIKFNLLFKTFFIGSCVYSNYIGMAIYKQPTNPKYSGTV